MKHRKRNLHILLAVSVLMLTIAAIVTLSSAWAYNFAGEVGYFYSSVSGYRDKLDYSSVSAVNWTYTNKSYPFFTWFRVRGDDGTNYGSRKMSLKSSDQFIVTNIFHGLRVFLQGSREYPWDEYAYVSGTWEP